MSAETVSFFPLLVCWLRGQPCPSNTQTQAGGGGGPPSAWPQYCLFKVWLQAQFWLISLCSKEKQQQQRDFLQVVVKMADENGLFNGYIYLLNR